MPIQATITNNCKNIIVKVLNSDASGSNSLQITNGAFTHEATFPGGQAVYTTIVPTSSIGTEVGVFHVKHLESNTVVAHSAVIGDCDILCCLAKKMDELLDCNCECSKCASQLAEAQKIFLLIKAGEAELAAYSRGGDLLQAEAAIANAEKKYNKAVEICGGHCGCNC